MERLVNKYSEDEKIEILSTEKYWLHTAHGKLLDLQMGNSAFVFGYSDRDIIDKMRSNDTRFIRNGDGETSKEIKHVISNLLELSNMAALSWTVSGTDAVETALAISEDYWKKIDSRKNKILSLIPCYHGSSWLTRSLRSEVINDLCRFATAPKWLTLDQRHNSELQCLSEIKQHLETQAVGAIIIESIPWVQGVYPFSSYFWKELRLLCDNYNVLIILDDVAGCFGKVGKPFSNITLGIEVDIIAVGKSISGGYSPIGAALLNDQVYNCIGQAEFDHTYTYNPNVDGIVAISAVLDKLSKNVFDTDQLVKKTSQILDELKIPFRNQGLCFDLIVDMQEKYMKFKETKLSFNICNTESIPLIVPIIADDEYFNFLRIELSKVYDI